MSGKVEGRREARWESEFAKKVGRSGSLSREELGLSENREFNVRSRVKVLHFILASPRHALTKIKKETRFFPANRYCSRKLMF